MILLFSDLHLDNYRRFSHLMKGGINSRLNEQVEVVKKLLEIPIPKHTATVFLGDLFNGQGSSINKSLYLLGYHLVATLAEKAPLYLIVGNHDIYGDRQILEPFESIPNVFIVSKTVEVFLDGMKITMIPWGGSLPSEGDVLLGHLDVDGAKTAGGWPLEGTIHPVELENYNLVISGHWHSRQFVNGKIHYLGAVMANDFGDSDEDFGVTLLNNKRELNFIKIPSPHFIPIIITNDEDMKRFSSEWAKAQEVNYYRLILKDRKIKLPKFDHTVDLEWDIQEKMEARLVYKPEDSIEEILCKFIDQDPTTADKDSAKKILREVMGDVS